MASTISGYPNGPYGLACDEAQPPELRRSSGKVLPAKGNVALCRCGGSKNKPFCDGTHKKIGFKADGSHVADSTE